MIEHICPVFSLLKRLRVWVLGLRIWRCPVCRGQWRDGDTWAPIHDHGIETGYLGRTCSRCHGRGRVRRTEEANNVRTDAD
jgi:hypothetical protein